MGARTGRNRYYTGPVSDHYDGSRFFNPGIAPMDNGFLQVLRWKLTQKRGRWTRALTGEQDHPPQRSETMRVAMIGHSSLLLQVAGINLLVDPVWSERASPLKHFGPRRYNPPGIAYEDLPRIDAVLITHNHYDHLDLPTLSRLCRDHDPRIIAPLGNDAILKRAGVNARIETGDWGDALTLSEQVRMIFWPAYHWSARGISDRQMALWCGFVLQTPHGVIYLAGDTGYGGGAIFRDIEQSFGAPRLAILPIGAYEPRWFMKAQHTNPADAVQIMQDCGAVQALGVHWNTFCLTNEAQNQPAEDLRKSLLRQGIAPHRFVPLTPGKSWSAKHDDDIAPELRTADISKALRKLNDCGRST